MSGAGLDQHPYITVTKAGVTKALPAQLVGPPNARRPVGVSRTPKVSFPQPVALGDTGARRNYDIDEFELATWTEGMGEDVYPGHVPPQSFNYGQLETRYPGVLTLRPEPVQLGGLVSLHPDHHASILELGQPEARLLIMGFNSVGVRLTSTNTWVALMAGASPLGMLTQGLLAAPGAYACNGTNLWRSADGVTWSQMAKGAMTAPTYLAQFDNRLWALNIAYTGSPGIQTATLYQSTDVHTAAAGGGTWAAGPSYVLPATEFIVRLFVWVDPNDNERPALWLLTERRLLFLDYYSQTPSWQEWFVARRANTSSLVKGWATVHPKNNGLYASFGGYDSRWVWEFIGPGRTVARYSPNAKGGMPYDIEVILPFAGEGVQPRTLTSSVAQSPWGLWADHLGLYVFGGADEYWTGANEGLIVMADPGAFHGVWGDRAQYLGAGGSARVLGGGIGDRTLWVAAWQDTTAEQVKVWEFSLDGQERLPQQGYRRYDRPPRAKFFSGWMHMGFRNVWKNLRYIEIDCLKSSGLPGLDTATIAVAFKPRHAAPVALGTLTDATLFPAVLTTPGGIDFREGQLQLTVDATAGSPLFAPYIRSIKLGYRPRPKQRYTYAVRVDLTDQCLAFRTDDGKFKGETAASLRLWVDELGDNDDNGRPDALVTLSYGGEGNSIAPRYRSVPDCEVLVTAQESPDGGDGMYLIAFNDVSPPASG